ncbi:hypothetical protein COBT_003207 [Conglomerata obtusa]
MAEEASMDDKLAVQTIIKNMKCNQTLYRLHLKNSNNIQHLLKLVDIIEADNEETLVETQCEEIFETQNKDNSKDITSLINRIEKLTLTVSQSNQDKTFKAKLFCKNCNRNGHTGYQCNFTNNSSNNNISNPNTHYRKPYHKNDFDHKNRRTNFQQNEFNRTNTNPTIYHKDRFETYKSNSSRFYKTRKFALIEELLNKELTGTIGELKPQIKNISITLSEYLKNIPDYYRARETINKNDLLAEEILKCLQKTKENIKTISSQDYPNDKIQFDILTAKLNINHNIITAIIDTGASHSVISKTLAEKLNIPIYKNEKTNLSLANNDTISTVGKCYNIPIILNNHVSYFDAIVLENLNKDLLIGNN